LPFVQCLVGLDLNFLFQAVGLHLHIALEADGQDPKLGCHLHHQVEGGRVDLLLFDLDELEQAGAVE
jgi:hypothetical protein